MKDAKLIEQKAARLTVDLLGLVESSKLPYHDSLLAMSVAFESFYNQKSHQSKINSDTRKFVSNYDNL